MGHLHELSVNDEPFPAYLATPDGSALGGLILIHEVWGLDGHITDVADRFADEGYLVLAPDLLHDSGVAAGDLRTLQEEHSDPERRSRAQPRLRELMSPLLAPEFAATTAAKVRTCFDDLAGRDELEERIGAVGFCLGGTYVFTLAVEEPRLKAAVPFYGHADFATAQLAKITAPVLAFYGGDDEALMASLQELTTRMNEAGVDFTAEVYQDAGHAFFNDTNRFAYNALAAESAWNQTLSFLTARLS